MEEVNSLSCINIEINRWEGRRGKRKRKKLRISQWSPAWAIPSMSAICWKLKVQENHARLREYVWCLLQYVEKPSQKLHTYWGWSQQLPGLLREFGLLNAAQYLKTEQMKSSKKCERRPNTKSLTLTLRQPWVMKSWRAREEAAEKMRKSRQETESGLNTVVKLSEDV